jgi:23S rRNA (uracil1939-C5)-methyltransferase
VKNRIFENVRIESMAAEGKCIAHVNGRVVFVENAAPGDIVDLKITDKKKRFLNARPITFHQLSDRRTEPFCDHFSLCGGCKWQHVDYNLQIDSKRQQIIDQFQRIGRFPFPEVKPLLAAPNTTQYRNKLEYTFSNRRWLTNQEISHQGQLERNGVGFHIPGHFDRIIDVHQCHLQKEPTNAIRNGLRSFALKQHLGFYDIKENKGLLRNLIVRTSSTGHVMVIVQFGEDSPEPILQVMQHLNDNFPAIDSLYYVVNEKKNETFNDLEVVLFCGAPYIEEQVLGLQFKLGPKSFFQTNTPQAEQLYAIAIQMAQLSGEETVFDLYCGTGTITSCVARTAHHAVGIDSVKEAIEDARDNARHNGISNIGFEVGDLKDVEPEGLIAKHGHPDVIITDPPRAGMHKDVVLAILKMQPARVVYISCNPATQARDLAILLSDYEISGIQPVDMFPHTHHLENIVALRRKL